MLKVTMKDAPIVERIDVEAPQNIGVIDTFVSKRQVEERGRIVNEYFAEEKDARDNFKNYKVEDFSIENLEATGAIADLKTVQYYDDNVDDVLSQLDSIVDGDDKNIDSK